MIIKRIAKIILIIIAAVLALVAGLLIFLTATEYHPEDVETLDIQGTAKASYSVGDPLAVMTWNIGYGALGDNADFFMDGGEMVKSADEARVQENLEGIAAILNSVSPDMLLLQEVDRDSSRSYHIDEVKLLRDKFPDYASTFGGNHKTPFVPYPIPPIGKVDAGVVTFTNSQPVSAERVQLPVPFKWPVRAVNLKRCVTETHIPLHDSDGKQIKPELVLFNLHLEAYDSGAGKIAQTKMLARLLKEEQDKGNYVIAGGDFNQTFATADKKEFPPQPGKWQPGDLDVTQFGDGWKFLMDHETASCRSLDQPLAGADLDSFQFYLIDGFIVSDNIRIEKLQTLDLGFVNSDHNPVVMEVITEE